MTKSSAASAADSSSAVLRVCSYGASETPATTVPTRRPPTRDRSAVQPQVADVDPSPARERERLRGACRPASDVRGRSSARVPSKIQVWLSIGLVVGDLRDDDVPALDVERWRGSSVARECASRVASPSRLRASRRLNPIVIAASAPPTTIATIDEEAPAHAPRYEVPPHSRV